MTTAIWRISLYHPRAHVIRQCTTPHQQLVIHARVAFSRSYATVESDRVAASASRLLSRTLDRKQQTVQREDYVGPFQLGLISPTPRDGAKEKKWSELTTAGKVARTTARTSNLAVILLGAGLSAVLIYALTSELFSKNSATVLYGQACEKIKGSSKLAQYLQAPLIFHNNPPTALRPRHRNHLVSSQIVLDSDGKEHMLLHFYVEGRPPGTATSSAESEEPFVDIVVHWTKDTVDNLSKMTYDDFVNTVEARADAMKEAAKEMFRFLSGQPASRSEPEPEPLKPIVKEEVEEKGWASGFTGLFSGLRGSSRSSTESGAEAQSGRRLYDEGEVHVDLVMNDQGYFEFRYLLVDIPNSRSWSAKRVFVERADGVKVNEAVMSWYS
ncbi:uncharacterized protein LAESUDRAFT_726178 [Laetiporus sulphureus 93-53]|uniref:Mitochondrial import inner membrane translocase subunit Tim21 n=1 Tax=Laetiporus sulphureus 93-53 TaxID=1314785 RepID=A0A165E6R3_9APHY|nr:uncharacterized protein LAESUDRAFT_726178 [Laetiporus sulphureus 93-53]KZT06345.1 hypothetical protein LAESUDRAFT_726178 [Laetiporus sulphureus 93-53]